MAGAESPSPKATEQNIKKESKERRSREAARMVKRIRRNPALQIIQNTMALEAMKKEAGIEEEEEPDGEAVEIKDEEVDVKQEDDDNSNEKPKISSRAEDAIREVIAQRRRDREAREVRLQALVNPAPAPAPQFESEREVKVTVTRSGRVVKPSLKARERMECEAERKGNRNRK